MANTQELRDFLEWYRSQPEYAQEQEERRQSAQFERDRVSADDTYRNRALDQSARASAASVRASTSNARTAANASMANARIAARTSRENAELAARTTLANTKMEIDARYRLMRERLNELEIPTLHLDAWYKQQQVSLARANLELEARGPRHAFQYASAMRQNTGTPLPASLAAMAGGQPLPAFEAPGGTPEAITFDALARKYGLAGSAPAGDGVAQSDVERETAALEAMRQAVSGGPHRLDPNAYDSMTGYEQAIFQSGLGKLGYDADDWIERMRRSAISQGDPRAA